MEKEKAAPLQKRGAVFFVIVSVRDRSRRAKTPWGLGSREPVDGQKIKQKYMRHSTLSMCTVRGDTGWREEAKQDVQDNSGAITK